MQIAILTSHAYSGFGGGFQALRWHALALRDLGHDVTVFTRNAPSKSALDNWVDGVPMAYYNPGVEANFDVALNVDHFTHSYPLAPSNLEHVFFPMAGPPDEKVRIYTNSQYTANAVKQAWNRDAEVMYIPIEPDYKPPTVPKGNFIIHVSRFSEPSAWADKGHRQLIQAWRRIYKHFPGWELHFIGSVDPRHEDYFSELMQRASFSQSIKFFPNVSHEDMIKMYQRSAILWHATGVSIPNVASAQEHLGLTPVEASASGCVPIVFNSGGMPEVVKQNGTGWLYDDIEELPERTINLIQDNYKWSIFQQQGIEWGRSWQNYDNFKMRIAQMLAGEPIGDMIYAGSPLVYAQQDVLCIIPTYNNVPMLKECLESLKATAPNMRVLVINNGDPISEDLGVKVVDAGQNLGFAGAYKFAEQFISPEVDRMILMLNDDVKAIHGSWLEAMLKAISRDGVGIVGAKLVYESGNLQHAGGKIDWSRPDIGYHLHYQGGNSIQSCMLQEVDFVTGACMLVRQELFHMPDELSGLLNYEEAWLSFEAREKGFRTVYQPASTLLHREGQTKSRTPESLDKIEKAKRVFRDRWQPKST